MKIKFNLEFTTSKTLSFLIFIVGSILAFYLKEKQVFLDTITVSALLSGVKAVSESIPKRGTE